MPLLAFPASKILPEAYCANAQISSVNTAISEFEKCVKTEKWKAVPSLIYKLDGLADAIFETVALYREMEACQRQALVDMTRRISDFDKKARKVIQALTPAETETAVKAVLDSDANSGRKARVVELLRGAAPKPSLDFRIGSELERLCEQYVHSRVIAREADFASLMIGIHNNVRKLPKKLAVQTVPVVADIKDEIAGMRARLSDAFANLHTTLKSNASADALVVAAEVHLKSIRHDLGISAINLGNLLAYMEGASSENRREPMCAALEFADLSRYLTLQLAYCEHIRVFAQAGDCNDWLATERKSATKALNSKTPTGKPVTLRDLFGKKFGDHKFVQVEGLVAGLRLESGPSRGKYSSIFELVDPISKEHVSVRAHMFNLHANGVDNGAFCRLNGYTAIPAEWSDQGIGLEIDRVSLTDQRKTSFVDDVAYRMKSYFRLYLDEMNMQYTPVLLKVT